MSKPDAQPPARALRRPRRAQLYADKAAYWDRVQQLRDADGLPSWAHDFIGVHPPPSFAPELGWSLTTPTLLFDHGKRPGWAQDRFGTMSEAARAARRLARACEQPIHVVIC